MNLGAHGLLMLQHTESVGTSQKNVSNPQFDAQTVVLVKRNTAQFVNFRAFKTKLATELIWLITVNKLSTCQ